VHPVFPKIQKIRIQTKFIQKKASASGGGSPAIGCSIMILVQGLCYPAVDDGFYFVGVVGFYKHGDQYLLAPCPVGEYFYLPVPAPEYPAFGTECFEIKTFEVAKVVENEAGHFAGELVTRALMFHATPAAHHHITQWRCRYEL